MYFKKILNFGSRVIFIYIVTFVIVSRFVNIDKALTVSKLKTLNRIMPDLGELTDFAQQKHNLSHETFDQYAFYYKKASEYVPSSFDSADALTLLGFCYYYMGKPDQARSVYEKSVKLKQEFFWSNYNLGVLYLKNKQWEEALSSLSNALAQSPEKTIKMVYASKIYQQLVITAKIPPEKLIERMVNGYKDAQRLRILAQYALSHPTAEPSLIFEKVQPRIF